MIDNIKRNRRLTQQIERPVAQHVVRQNGRKTGLSQVDAVEAHALGIDDVHLSVLGVHHNVEIRGKRLHADQRGRTAHLSAHTNRKLVQHFAVLSRAAEWGEWERDRSEWVSE